MQERYWKLFSMASLHLYITNAGIPQGSVLGQTLLLVFINDLPNDVLSRIGIYADGTTLYSSLGKSVIFEKVESAGELELDLRSIVELGDRWLVTFNTTKSKLLSFNRHKDPLGPKVSLLPSLVSVQIYHPAIYGVLFPYLGWCFMFPWA